jgi:GxxExxY protein
MKDHEDNYAGSDSREVPEGPASVPHNTIGEKGKAVPPEGSVIGDAVPSNSTRVHPEPASAFSAYSFNLPSPLSEDQERLMAKVIGCAITVHQELGPGFLESIYKKAMRIELMTQGIAFEAERPIHVVYRGIEIPGQRVDLIVENQLVIELKTVLQFDRVHVAQVLSYLKTTGLRGGLLINFRTATIKAGLKRIVL